MNRWTPWQLKLARAAAFVVWGLVFVGSAVMLALDDTKLLWLGLIVMSIYELQDFLP